jgi:ABC-type amino acid transport substrate-binding protein
VKVNKYAELALSIGQNPLETTTPFLKEPKMSRKYSSIAIIVATSALAFALFHTPHDTASSRKETAYERVIRTRTLRCGYGTYPVTEEIDPNTKQLKGVVPEFTEELGKKLNLKIDWVEEVIWGQQQEALNAGRIDAVCSTDGPWNYAMAALVDYAEPMIFFPVYLYGRQGMKHFETPEAANSEQFTFSSYEGDISLAMPLDRFPKAHRVEVPGSLDASLMVVNVITGKADIVLTDPMTINQFNKNNKQKLEKLYDKPLAIINMSFSVAKGQSDLLQMLNQGFQLLQQLGISDQILDKYDPERKLFLRPAKRWER